MAEGGWISKYGVPGIIASVAVFAFQQQQQVFDRLQNSIVGGYQYYSQSRTGLQYSDDADRELSVLRIIGIAFPNIYCDIRGDIYNRASAIQPTGTATDSNGRALIDSTDLQVLRNQLASADHPTRREYPENIIQAWTSWGANNGHPCAPLNEPQQQVAANETPTASAAAPAPAASDSPAPPPAPMQAQGRGATVAQGSLAARDLGAEHVRAETIQLASAPSLTRVFFQIPIGGSRDQSVADAARNDLAQYNYRVMRGVERLPASDFQGPEIRYYGEPNEAPPPQVAQLKAYLDNQFHLNFRLTPIARRFPNMPHDNVEVWIP